MLLEICAVNIQSALAAQAGGAGRIELCCALDGGGLTPSPGTIREVCSRLSIPVMVLIRPREGNFCYTPDELAIMLGDIRFCREAGAAGVVVGALTADGDFDRPAMEAMRDAAGAMEVCSHRAFDFAAKPADALETLIDMGFCRVLSSGQKATAFEGRENLRRWVQQAAGRIEIMPGSGIDETNIRAIAEATGAREFHGSATRRIKQPTGHTSIPRLEWEYLESDADWIRTIREAVEA